MRYSLGVSMKQLSLLLMTAVTRKQMYRHLKRWSIGRPEGTAVLSSNSRI